MLGSEQNTKRSDVGCETPERDHRPGCGWGVHLRLEVYGPKEGPAIAVMNYPDITKEMALIIQNALAQLALDLSKKGLR